MCVYIYNIYIYIYIYIYNNKQIHIYRVGPRHRSRQAQPGPAPPPPTSPQCCIKSSFSIALICTTSRRISASASTNQVSEKGNLTLLWWSVWWAGLFGGRSSSCARTRRIRWTAGDQDVISRHATHHCRSGQKQQSGIKSPFFRSLNCTCTRRNPATCGTHQCD